MTVVPFEDWCRAWSSGVAITGLTHEFPNGRVTLRRADDKLVLDYAGNSVWFAAATITHTRFAGDARRLTINNWSTDYQSDWNGIAITCESESDFDFGVMLVELRDNVTRQSGLFVDSRGADGGNEPSTEAQRQQ